VYVVIQDSAGHSKLVAHPDPAAAATGAWTRWTIPLSDLTAAGVQTTQVRKITIGVGDRSNPKAGGAGLLYIDDVGYGHPASTMPVQAHTAQPANGAVGQGLTTTLGWQPGREGGSHKVFFGADSSAIANGTAAAQTVTDPVFDPGLLNFGTTYYWRVDEVVSPVTYPGDVWSFTTQEFGVIDDFEAYDEDQNRIYQTWIDGMTDGQSGSTVGYMTAPFAEQRGVHAGKQSMPLAYNNKNLPFFSETTRNFAAAQDWTVHGATHLDLWFEGFPATGSAPSPPNINAPAPLYLIVTDSAGQSQRVVHPNPAATNLTTWTEWRIALSDLAGVNLTTVQKLTLGVGDKNSPKPGGTGKLYIDDIGYGHPVK
jgi:hypothetical protein